MPKFFPLIRSHRRHALLAVLMTTTILAAPGLAAAAESGMDGQPTAMAPVTNQAGFAPLVKSVKPAVVNIATTEKIASHDDQDLPDFPPGSPFGEMFRHFNHNQGNETRHALGSGFIVDPAGYIVTNNHVVDGARKIMVTLDDGSSYPAAVKGRDAKTDLALLKVEAGKPLPYVAFGSSAQEEVGDWVIAVGNPFGLGGSVTAGIVSAHGRNLNSGPYDDFIQIDAPINPGNSGGPLFNQSGKVIGIDTAIYSPNGGSVGIGFAIPSDLASKVVAQLREHGTVARGWIGIQMQPMTATLAKAEGRPDADGVLVDRVEPDSPASRAKLQQGDVIIALNGAPVKGTREFALAVADTPTGSAAKLTVWRDGQDRKLEIVVGTQAAERTAAASNGADGGPIGMELAALTPADRQTLNLDSTVKGVVVAQVKPDSLAAESGVLPGDIIIRVGNDKVAAPADARAKIRAAEREKKEAVPLLVMRDGTTYYLALQLAQG